MRLFHDAQVRIAARLLEWPDLCLGWLDTQPAPRDHKRIAKADKVHRGVDVMTPDAGVHLRTLLSAVSNARREGNAKGAHLAQTMAPVLVRYLSFRVLVLGVTRSHEGCSVVTPSLMSFVCRESRSSRATRELEGLAEHALRLRKEIIIANQSLAFAAGRSLYHRISATEKVTSQQEDAISCCRHALMEAVDIWLPGKCKFPGAGADLALSTLFNYRLKHVSDEWRTQNFAIVEPRGNHVQRARIAKERSRLAEESGEEVSDVDAARSLVEKNVLTETKAREVVMLPKVSNFTALAAANAGDGGEDDVGSVEEICADDTPSALEGLERADRAAIGLRLIRNLRPADQLVLVGLRGGDMLREAAARWIDASAQDLFSAFAADVRGMAIGNRRVAVAGVRIFG